MCFVSVYNYALYCDKTHSTTKHGKTLNVYDMLNIYPSSLNIKQYVFYTKHMHYKCKWHFSSRVNCVLVLK